VHAAGSTTPGKDLVYPQSKEFNHLVEYSEQFSTVEVDQWFWSLFKKGAVVLLRTYINLLSMNGLFTIIPEANLFLLKKE
jgi:hypothetical protein